MGDELQRWRLLTGITEDMVADDIAITLLQEHNGSTWCAAADAADLIASSHMSGVGLTSVEDISIDRRRPMQAWLDRADRWRTRCADESAADDGPFVVEFRDRSTGLEAVEHG